MAKPAKKKKIESNAKTEALLAHTEDPTDSLHTTNHGLPVQDDQNTLKAGPRGPSLLEDFHFREKMTHFDHERIPERVVHARGAAAHGVFQVYESLAPYTKAKFLQDPSARTPVFVRFSTVVGSRGSSDLARDVRGFAVKFYTEEGNFDLVGNNIPVFFIQDGMKFPDLVHAIKPEPHREIPQASSAHDTFWDFISLMPESMHMVLWVMSDRAIPRSFRMMEGFGVHTFRFVNEAGQARFVKFHWKPMLGVHSVVWDEAQKISGVDPDFHRRDLWHAIEQGNYPEWELGVQIVEERDEHQFDFDLLDATKLIPEEQVPVRRIGKLTLNRNPQNFFAETEQVAFHPGHVVPGIDFTDDPLLAGRLFSYIDTQLTRLGGPNFQEIPINRPLATVHNNQRDGAMRQTINASRVSYHPNSLGGGCPMQAGAGLSGFTTYAQAVEGRKSRARSEKFFDHFTQATLFWNSQSHAEKLHIVQALRFELGKVETLEIRQRMLGLLLKVDRTLAGLVAQGLGLAEAPPLEGQANYSVPADADPEPFQPKPNRKPLDRSAALSMAGTVKTSIATRKIAILAADGTDNTSVAAMIKALSAAGAEANIVAPRLGILRGAKGAVLPVHFSLLTAGSVLFDAVYVPGGTDAVEILKGDAKALMFLQEAYLHCKTIAAMDEGVQLLMAAHLGQDKRAQSHAEGLSEDQTTTLLTEDSGIIVGRASQLKLVIENFIRATAQHRHWSRETKGQVPA